MFILGMVLLNLTVAGVNYKFFTIGLYYFAVEAMKLARNIAVIFFSVTSIDLFLYFFFKKYKFIHKTFKCIFLAVNICLFMIDLFTLYFFEFPFNYAMMEVLTVSNFRESIEFTKLYFLEPHFYIFLAEILVGIFLFYCLSKFLCRNKIILFLIIAAGSLLGLASTRRDIVLNRGTTRLLRSTAITRIGSILFEITDSWRALYDAMNSPKEILITKNEKNVPYIIFVLGESTTRNHFSLYGYELETNPLLQRRAREERFYIFDDVIAPNGYTVAVLQKLFSFYRYGSLGNWFEYTSLFEILNKAGYKTFYLSNQENRPGTDPRNIYQHQCSYSELANDLITETEVFLVNMYDESLLPLLDKTLKNEIHDSTKNFFVLHMLGTHAYYSQRYPKEYEKFSAQQEGGYKNITNFQKGVRAEYDNAILYDDFVINEVIKRFEDKNAVVIYISDHGDEVYDVLNTVGHSDGMKSRSVAEIPMIVWMSEKFHEAFPELEARIAQSVHRPYMVDDMINTLLDLAGIATTEYDPAKSVINPDFDASRERIYAGYIYDKESGFNDLP